MVVKELVFLWMATMVTSKTEDIAVVEDSNKTLTCIPNNYPSNITKLILHHNLIMINSSDIQALSKLPNLRELDLSYNRIAELPTGLFSGLENLEVLSLRGNQLPTIRNETFTGVKKLKKLDLQENPLHCTCLFLSLIKYLTESGVQTGGTCATPGELTNKTVLDMNSTCPSTTNSPLVTATTTTTTTTSTATTATTAPSASTATTATTTTFTTTARWTSHVAWTTSGNLNITQKDTDKSGKQETGVSNTWKFLAGVIVIALCTSMFIVCAIKSPSWYKLLFNYRHQRLREMDEPNVFSTGRYSNFSLDTEQTETSAHELDLGPELEDEDGFIEDRYIQPEDYKEQVEDYKDNTEDYKDHRDFDEV